MRLPLHGRSGLSAPVRLAIAALVLAAALPGSAAVAQYGGYGGPPPGYDDPADEGSYRPAPRRRERQPVGYNCDAIQQGLTGPKPFACPLPGPRPLGVRCFCDLPIASFSPPQTAVGRVVP